MRSAGALAAASVLAIVFQTTVFPAIPGLPVVPDLLLVLTVYLALRHQGVGGVVGAFLFGYFLDTFSGTVLGVHAFAFTVAYAAVYLVARRVWTESALPIMAVVFLGSCVRAAATAAVTALMETGAPVWQHVAAYGFLEALVAALVAPVVFGFVAWEKRALGLE